MSTDTSKITGAADDLSDKLTKGGSAAKTLGAEIAAAIASIDGRVTKLESGTTQPPIEPPIEPPTGNTKGKVEKFTATTGNVPMTIEAQTTKNLNVNGNPGSENSWSIVKIDDYTLKYEVRSGDHATSVGGGWSYGASVNRSETEFMPRIPQDVTFTVEYGFILHSGAAMTTPWMICGQFHFDKGSGSPPVSVAFFSGEKMTIVVRGPDNRENRVWSDPNPIQRGKKYAMKLEIRVNRGGTGTCKVWRDGVQIVNHNGALGSGVNGDTHFWKQGIYRETANETMAATYSNSYPRVS